jgi:type VI secretion system protein ImpH
VIARLLAEPHRFAFFQAVRLLERWFGKVEPGGSAAVLSMRLRFRNSLSLGFPASEIAHMRVIEAPRLPVELGLPAVADSLGDIDEPATDEADPATAQGPCAAAIARIEMTPAFMGLLGSGGALPIYYTELLAQRETYHRDTAARAFLDVFQHRAIALFYQAWRKHRLPVQYESDRLQQFLPLVLAVAGVGQRSLRDRLHGNDGGVADETLAFYAGLLQQRPVSAPVIRQIVSEYFGVQVALEQFVGRWFHLPPDSVSLLGRANASLGAGATVGERVWQRDLRMRLTIGPMPLATLHRFLPGGSAALALRELLSMLTGVSLEYEVRLALRACDVRSATLGSAAGGARLGWDSFLLTRPGTRDRHEPGYDIHALA